MSTPPSQHQPQSQSQSQPQSQSHPTPFTFPPEYSFPPFFTRQTNLTTRHAQLTKWASLVLAYCRHHRIVKLPLSDSLSAAPANAASSTTPATAPPAAAVGSTENGGRNSGGGGDVPRVGADELFHNRRINRRLALSDVREVINFLRRDGRAEYVDGADESGGGGDVVWVYWRTPEEWAALVEGWVDATGQRGSVLTLYELVEGDGTRGTGEWRPPPSFFFSSCERNRDWPVLTARQSSMVWTKSCSSRR